MPKPRVLLIGWDAADWKVIQPLLAAGEMPNLARFLDGGVQGNLATIYPALSPMLWTSIATGKRAYKHGIHGFIEPLPDGSGIRPITLLGRKTKAVWNILNQTGHRSLVVGWWPSHPAEPIHGVMVSNLFDQPGDRKGTIHPTAKSAALGELVVNPMEFTGEFIRPFVPEYEKVNQAEDKRLHGLAKIIAETMSVHAVATELLATEPWDFAGIYYSALDHFAHGFMRFHPPQLPWVSDEDFAIYRHVIANAYRYHDAMLGALLRLAGPETAVILMSDHGFHPDHLRPAYIPAEPAGPSVEHRHFGIFCAKGPALAENARIYAASLLDICPTILALFGLPPGRDMDGKVLVTAFKNPPTVEPIESWDLVPGDAGLHSADVRLDPAASAEAFKQLIELGYVAPPAEDMREVVAECTRELKYNLARAYRDANCCGECASLVEELWEQWPREHRFGILLIDCLGALRQVARRRVAIEELARRVETFQSEAKAKLEQRKAEKAESPDKSPKPAAAQPADPTKEQAEQETRRLREQFEERQWQELAHGRPGLLQWLWVSQELQEKKPGDARQRLRQMTEAEASHDVLNQHMAGALAALGDRDAARSLLEESLQADPENPHLLAQLASLHLNAKRLPEAIAAAADSLSLLYFQPALHGLLGQALMASGRFAEAEQELKVAVTQSPRHLAAHELLGQLYRDNLGRPQDALAQEGRARSLRHELEIQRREGQAEKLALGGDPMTKIGAAKKASGAGESPKFLVFDPQSPVPPPFEGAVDADKVITIVSGLPRSGTSLMMQLLAAGGVPVLTDAKRAADADNPLGYLEYEPAMDLARDAAWVPQARGKVVKIVAQLLPFLPAGEYYRIIFMERDLSEVLASQTAMLAREGRRGAALDPDQLRATYTAQLQRVRSLVVTRPRARLLPVAYAGLLTDPVAGVERVAAFLGMPFDRTAAAAAVRPELRRQKT